MLFPVKQLTELCHQYNCLVLIDGANTPGHVELDLDDIGADFYTGEYMYLYLSYAKQKCFTKFNRS